MANERKEKPPSAKNRRKWARKHARSTAKVECPRGTLGLGPNLALELLDNCENGVGLIFKAALNPEEEVEVIIRDFGQRQPIKQIARVCWCFPHPGDRFIAGLRFDSWVAYAAVQQVSRTCMRLRMKHGTARF